MNLESICLPNIYLPTNLDSKLATPDNNFYNRFIKHNIDTGRANLCESPEKSDFIILFQEWSFKLPEYIKKLADCSLVQEYSKKMYVINYDSTVGEGFLPGCYVSLRQSTYKPEHFIPCAYPKSYNEFITPSVDTYFNPEYLFSFRGTLHSHPIRKVIFEALKHNDAGIMCDNTKAFHTHTPDEKKTYINELKNSVFALCPRGTSPNSYRLFEAMSLGRCPVIISDEWVETPGPDWGKFSLRIPESEAKSLPEILKNRREEGIEKGKIAFKEWQKHFTEEKVYQSYLRQVSRLHHSHNDVTQTFDELKKYWRSYTFLRNNEWTLKQKIMRRLIK